MLITEKHFPLITVFGGPAEVDFPVEYAMDIHKKFPGLIKRMVHTHLDGCTWMSEEDRTTLKAWTMALAPYRIIMEVICYEKRPNIFRKMFWYELESLDIWLKGNREKPRKLKLFESDLTNSHYPKWVKEILKLSEL